MNAPDYAAERVALLRNNAKILRAIAAEHDLTADFIEAERNRIEQLHKVLDMKLNKLSVSSLTPEELVARLPS